MSASNLWPIEDRPPARIRRIGRQFSLTPLSGIVLPDCSTGLRLSTPMIRMMSAAALECIVTSNPIVVDGNRNLVAGLRTYRVLVEYYSDRAANHLTVKVPVVRTDRAMPITNTRYMDALSQLLFTPRDLRALAHDLRRCGASKLWRAPLSELQIAELLGVSARTIRNV